MPRTVAKERPEKGKAKTKKPTLFDKVKGYVRLIRLHSLIADCLASVLAAYGAWTYQGILPGRHEYIILGNLFLVGVFIHISMEVLNDYVDLRIDSKNPELSKKPLVSGIISKKEAMVLLIISTILIFILAIPLFSIISFTMLATCVALVTLYDLFSKKNVHTPIFLAGWAFTLGLFGGISAGGYTSLLDIPPLVWIICLLGGMQMWMNTAILGHLKDVENDGNAGVLTFPIYLGVRVSGKKQPPHLFIPPHFKGLTLAFQVLNLAVAFVPLIFWDEFYSGTRYWYVALGALILLTAFIMWAQFKILWYPVFDRKKLMRLMAVREVSAYFLVIALLIPICGPVVAAILVLLPFVWFLVVNFLFTGNPMEPPI